MLASSPRLAASLLLLRDDPSIGLQVFMQLRNKEMSFAAGALVFPGGSVDPDDFRIAASMKRVDTDSDADGELALKIAAIRETFEECGFLLAKRQSGQPLSAAEIPALRRIYLDGKQNWEFGAFLASEDLVLSTSELSRFAHWITPVGRPKRFDTHFFIARVPSHDAGMHDGTEAVDSKWLAPDEAVAAAASGLHNLMFPTRMNLLRLARNSTVEHALNDVANSPIVTVVPELLTNNEGALSARIPLEAGYGGEIFLLDQPPAGPQQQ